jgi:hypothetical protein
MSNRFDRPLDEPRSGISQTISRADRAASRSVSIAVFTLLGGIAAFVLLAVAKRMHHHNGLLPLALPPAMLIGHGWGIVEAIRAQRGRTARTTQATIGLLLNGLIFAILLLLVAAIVVLTGIWAGLGR